MFSTIIAAQSDWNFQAPAVPNHIHTYITVHTILNLPIWTFDLLGTFLGIFIIFSNEKKWSEK